MPILEILKIAADSILVNKVRAFLTTLGIIIGISAVIGLLSVGEGAQTEIINRVQGFGANTITVIPIASFSFSNAGGMQSMEAMLNNTLDKRVVNILKNEITFPEIAAVSPEISKSFEVAYRSKASYFTVESGTSDYFNVHDLEIAEGRFYSKNDNLSSRKVAVLGTGVTEKLFGENEAMGKKVKIKGRNFNVIGLLESKGSMLDDQVYVPINSAGNFLTGNNNPTQIVVKVGDEQLVNSVATKIEEELYDFYRVSDPDDANFSVVTTDEFLSIIETITGIFTTLLASIAAISLVVGGIGIMNIMLVSVTERTKEIGLRKAVGAKQRAILGQFLMESVVLTIFGGVIGIGLGLLLGSVIGQLGNIPVVLSPTSIILATSVSACIGIIFGFYPAYRAARLNPIDALRYE